MHVYMCIHMYIFMSYTYHIHVIYITYTYHIHINVYMLYALHIRVMYMSCILNIHIIYTYTLYIHIMYIIYIHCTIYRRAIICQNMYIWAIHTCYIHNNTHCTIYRRAIVRHRLGADRHLSWTCTTQYRLVLYMYLYILSIADLYTCIYCYTYQRLHYVYIIFCGIVSFVYIIVYV